MTTLISLKGQRDVLQNRVVLEPCDCDPEACTHILYIGRRLCMGGWQLKGDSPLANHNRLNQEGTNLDDAVIAFDQNLALIPNVAALLNKIRGKTIACWCVNKTNTQLCHGHILLFHAEGVITPPLQALLKRRPKFTLIPLGERAIVKAST